MKKDSSINQSIDSYCLSKLIVQQECTLRCHSCPLWGVTTALTSQGTLKIQTTFRQAASSYTMAKLNQILTFPKRKKKIDILQTWPLSLIIIIPITGLCKQNSVPTAWVIYLHHWHTRTHFWKMAVVIKLWTVPLTLINPSHRRH